MLEASYQVGLGLEPTDELGPVGQLRTDDLDCHIPTDRGLGAAVDDRECPFTQLLTESVAPQGSAGHRAELQRRVGVENAAVELDQLPTRIQPELIAEAGSVILEDPGGLGLATGSEQRQHLQPDQPVAEGMLFALAGEAGEGIGVHAGREHRLVPSLGRHQPQLVESIDLRSSPFVAGHLLERFAPPQLQGLIEASEPIMDIEAWVGGGVDEGLEPEDVDLGPSNVEPPAGGLGDDEPIVTERPPESGEIGAQCGPRVRR